VPETQTRLSNVTSRTINSAKIIKEADQVARVKGTRSHFVLRTTRDNAALGGLALPKLKAKEGEITSDGIWRLKLI